MRSPRHALDLETATQIIGPSMGSCKGVGLRRAESFGNLHAGAPESDVAPPATGGRLDPSHGGVKGLNPKRIEKTKPPGDGLFSHHLTMAVSSALGRFTSVFGMGTGGATPL